MTRKAYRQKSYLICYAYTKQLTRVLLEKTPFELAFAIKIVILVEVRLLNFRVAHYDKDMKDKQMRVNLYLIKEV